MLIMGGNPAENHPCGFKWAIEAKRNRNAKMIVVDPRFTRTASVADLYCQLRVGGDIAFLGGIIHYAIENNRLAHDYLAHYTERRFYRERWIQAAGSGRRFFRIRRENPELR
jgi:formate dehydrogenase major subunit